MKRKTSKILIGCLSVLCVLGATSTIVGALSDGFKNWDTSTWFDKTTTTDKVSNEEIIATPDETQPVKMSVRYLGEENTGPGTIKKAQDVKPMTGLVITASLDSQYGECNSFAFSFDKNDSSLLNYTTTENTCTVNFLKKYFEPVKLTAIGKSNGKIYRGTITFNFMKSFLSDFIVKRGGSDGFFSWDGVDNHVLIDFSKEYKATDFVRISCLTDGTITPNLSFTETSISMNRLNVDWSNLFILDGETIKLKNDKNIFDKIVDDPYFVDKDYKNQYHIGNFNYKINNEYSTSAEFNFSVSVKIPPIVDGGVDMGGDIVVL